jgi:glycosyltransferase involved in cell wall biosynthesis
MALLPTVTAVVPVYNGEPFVAETLASALGQDYPQDRLDVIVVDDGSTDASAEIVRAFAEAAPRRLQFVRQANGGNVSAVNRALELARGELIALLDADDVWPLDKTRRQVKFLKRNPRVGLVYGDMCVIDGEGEVIQESWLEGDDPPHGAACMAKLLTGNSATASSIMFRRTLLGRLAPIPADIPFSDWWLALGAAEVSELGYMPKPRTLYRYHGNNMTLGAQGGGRTRELRKAMSVQRRVLRRIDLDAGSPEDIHAAWDAFERNAAEVLALAGSPFAALAPVTEDDRAAARLLAADGESALARGAAGEALARFTNAAAHDPWLEAASEGIADAMVVAHDDPDAPGQRPLADARSFVVLAYADELAASPDRLREYAGQMGDVDATLAIDATAMAPDAAAGALHSLVSDAGIGDPGPIDMLAVLGPLDAVGRARLARGVHAVWSDRQPAGHDAPWFSAARIGELRELASSSASHLSA